MKSQIVNRLNQLNLSFYQQFAESFNQSRNYYWEGWQKCLPTIEKIVASKPKTRPSLSVLDVGCGTARFASFLNESLKETAISYLGVDNSSELLKKASNRITRINSGEGSNFTLQNLDLLKNRFDDNQNYDLIVMFGVLHHMPGLENRKKLVAKLLKKLNLEGRLIFTLWRFPKFKRFRKKVIDPKLVGIDQNDLEAGDYILDWKKFGIGYRYCHSISYHEAKYSLVKKEQIEDTFLSDGKEHRVNRYIIAKRI